MTASGGRPVTVTRSSSTTTNSVDSKVIGLSARQHQQQQYEHYQSGGGGLYDSVMGSSDHYSVPPGAPPSFRYQSMHPYSINPSMVYQTYVENDRQREYIHQLRHPAASMINNDYNGIMYKQQLYHRRMDGVTSLENSQPPFEHQFNEGIIPHLHYSKYDHRSSSSSPPPPHVNDHHRNNQLSSLPLGLEMSHPDIVLEQLLSVDCPTEKTNRQCAYLLTNVHKSQNIRRCKILSGANSNYFIWYFVVTDYFFFLFSSSSSSFFFL
jgi:hypothetical protein